ncbi:hypothetical protein [Halovenus salina]|uniref:Uncharacterized protein n=1 Tax=Halovenus salina TaxID=1510225 RepID=A0ABD5VZD8_9EURY
MTVRDHPIAQDSAVVSSLSGIRDRVVAACKQSRIAEPAMGALRRLRSLRTTTEKETNEAKPAVANSRLLRMTRRVTAAVSNAGSASRLAGMMTGGRHLVESSWLYRWLTAEPEPDVVVIDLRETLTVGPWLRLLQRTIVWILPAALSSLLFRSCRRIHRILTKRPVQAGSQLSGLSLSSCSHSQHDLEIHHECSSV